MTYFTYSFSSNFAYPATISNNTSYKNVLGVLTSPFTGTQIHNNFYYLACSAVDNTTRITTLENLGVTVSTANPSIGYVIYNGTQESAGSFYSGQPLQLLGTNTFNCSVTNPLALGSSNIYSLGVITGQSIVFTSGTTTINQTSTLGIGSNNRIINFGEGTSTNYTSISSLIIYLNQKLKYNNLDTYSSAMNCAITSTGSPATSISNYGSSLAATFSDGTSIKYFYLYINDSYYSINAPTFAYKCSIAAVQNQTISGLISAIQNTLNAGATSLGYANAFPIGSVTQIGNNIVITPNTNRLMGGIYEFLLTPDTLDDGTNNSILSSTFLGLLPSGSSVGLNIAYSSIFGLSGGVSTLVEAFDLSSLIQFTYSGSGPYSLNLMGQQSSINLSFVNNNIGVLPLLSSSNSNLTNMGLGLSTSIFPLSTPSKIFYHSRYPNTLTYTNTPILNFSGDFNVNNFTCNNLQVQGTVTYSGIVNFSGTQTFGTLVTNGNLGVNGTTQISGYFDGGVSLPATSVGRINFNGSLYSKQFIGNSIGISIPSYIYNIPYSSTTPIGYLVYNDGAVSTPITGTGTSTATITFGSTSASPLFGQYDLLVTKPTSNCQGQGISYNFNIDYGMTSQAFNIEFLYNTSVNYVSGDMAIFVYDTVNGNYIPVSISAIPTTFGNPARFTASFFPSSSMNYRLIFHIATINTSTYTFQVNAVSVAPQYISKSSTSLINPWSTYNLTIGATTTAPTFSGNTITSSISKYRRVGSEMEISYHFIQSVAGSNTAGSGTYLFSLPIGLTIDWTVLANSSTLNSYLPVGMGEVYNGTSRYGVQANVNFSISNSAIILQYQSTLGTDLQVGSTTVPLTTAVLEYHFYCRIPIAQWTAGTNSINDYTEYASNNNAGTTLNTLYTTGMASGSLGSPIAAIASTTSGSVSYTGYTVTFSRPIQITDILTLEFRDAINGWASQSSLGIIRSFQNSTVYGAYWDYVSNDPYSINVYFANGGVFGNGATYGSISNTAWASYSTWYWRMRKTSNGNTAEVAPIIRAEYISSSVVNIPSSTNPILFDTIVEDTNTCVKNASSNWQFIAPAPGIYNIEVTTGMTPGRTYVAGESWALQLIKSGVYYTTIASHTFSAALTTINPFILCGNKTIRLLKGDYISVAIYYSNSNTGTSWAVNTLNTPRISIERIGH